MNSELIKKLKAHKQLKKRFALKFGISRYDTQALSDELINLSIKNNNIISASHVINFARDKNTAAYNIFNKLNNIEQIQLAEFILENISLIISSNNKIYNIKKKNFNEE